MNRPQRRRVLIAVISGIVAGLGLGAGVASPAFADPPGPTDYQSEVRSVEPETPAIEVGIIGGDSFLELRVAPGTEAMVIGYEGEDYLWFRPDGVVLENQNSPATYLNADRYGNDGVPDGARADAEPSWEQVATGGYWAWHDHRAHWMQSARPFGLAAGDQILEAVIPIVVDGDTVEVTVTSTWQPEPSPIAMWLGVVAGLGVAGLAWFLHARSWPARSRPARSRPARSRPARFWHVRSRRVRSPGSRGVPPIAATIPLVLLAVGVGFAQFTSLPSATGPQPIWVVLPLVSAVSAAVGVVLAVRGRRFAADAALLLVGVELAVWGFVKRDGLFAAIVPTGAPFWLDRFATAASLAGGVALAATALWWLFSVPASVSTTGRAADPVSDPVSDSVSDPVSDSRGRSDSRRPAHP